MVLKISSKCLFFKRNLNSKFLILLNVGVSTKFLCWNSTTPLPNQVMLLRSRATGKKLGLDKICGWSSQDGIHAFVRRHWRARSPPLPLLQQEGSNLQTRKRTRNRNLLASWSWTFQFPELQEINCGLSHLFYGILW